MILKNVFKNLWIGWPSPSGCFHKRDFKKVNMVAMELAEELQEKTLVIRYSPKTTKLCSHITLV
jgi:hypothetical protein